MIITKDNMQNIAEYLSKVFNCDVENIFTDEEKEIIKTQGFVEIE